MRRRSPEPLDGRVRGGIALAVQGLAVSSKTSYDIALAATLMSFTSFQVRPSKKSVVQSNNVAISSS